MCPAGAMEGLVGGVLKKEIGSPMTVEFHGQEKPQGLDRSAVILWY